MLVELASSGHVVVPPARAVLAAYSGLVIIGEGGRRMMRIDGARAARNADPDWCVAYAEGIGRAVTPIGEYSHLTMVVDDAGDLWGGFDDDYGFLGADVVEVVRVLLVEPGVRFLDREVAPLSDHGGGCREGRASAPVVDGEDVACVDGQNGGLRLDGS